MFQRWNAVVAMLSIALVLLEILVSVLPMSSVVAAPIASSGGWGWDNPLPQGNDLLSAWGTSSSNFYAVGDHGTILHYDGTTWNSRVSGTTEQIKDIWGTSASNIYVVGNQGGIRHYDGSSWHLEYDGDNSVLGVWGSSASDVFFVDSVGTIIRFNGSSWNYMASGTTAMLTGVWGTSSSDVFAVGYDLLGGSGVILHYDGNVGSTWTSMTGAGTNLLLKVWGSSSSDVFAAGYDPSNNHGVILHYDGSVWSSMSIGTVEPLLGLWGTSASNVYAVGGTSAGLVLHYNGSTWSTESIGTTRGLAGIWGSSATGICIVGGSGTILYYSGSYAMMGGGNLYNDFGGVWGASSSDVYVVGDAGAIVHYNGSTWTAMSSGTAQDLFGVWGSSSSDVFAVGASGTILHYNGSAWSSMTSGTSSALNGVWGTSSSNVFAVGASGTILHYNGSAWSAMTSGTSSDLNGVWGTSSSDVFAMGASGTILHYNGSAWSAMTSGTSSALYGVWGISSSSVFAVGASGTIRHYDGSVWSAMTSGTSSLVYAIWGTSPSDVFAVGDNSTALHYNGNTWTSMEAGIDNWLLGVWGSSSSDVFAVGAYGAILHYPEGSQPVPVVTVVSANQGTRGQSLSVTVAGWDFAGATAVSFGSGITVNSFTVNSGNQIAANISISNSALAGTRNVTVVGPGGTSTLTSGFTVLGPIAVTSVSPSQGAQGQSLSVVITGTDFTGATVVSFGSGITVNSFTVNSATQISAAINIVSSADLGSRDVSVVGPEGTSTLVGAFTVLTPVTVTSVSPNQGTQGESLTGVITGTNFTGVTAVSFGDGVTVNSFTVDSATQITASISISGLASAGSRDVSVYLGVLTGTLASGFTVLQSGSGEPTIVSLSPIEGKQGQSLEVVITGANFTGAAVVNFGDGIAVGDFTVDTSTQITAPITIADDASEGMRDVSVTAPGGTAILTEGFDVLESGKGGGCSCGRVSQSTPPNELLVGWATISLCVAVAYWAATRVARRLAQQRYMT